MPRTYLPLLPLPVLAVIVAVAACSRPRSEPVSHVIPTASPYLAPSAPAAPPPPAAIAAAPSTPEDAPTAAEVKAFERPVLK